MYILISIDIKYLIKIHNFFTTLKVFNKRIGRNFLILRHGIYQNPRADKTSDGQTSEAFPLKVGKRRPVVFVSNKHFTAGPSQHS